MATTRLKSLVIVGLILSLAQLQNAFAAATSDKGASASTHHRELIKFHDMQRRSKDGNIKPDGLSKGIQQRRALLQAAPATPTAGAGISSSQWKALGPANHGGRIRAILIDPTNSNSIWIGSVSGGIWHSADAGVTWSPVNDFMGTLSISSLAMAPGNSNVMYAGTGEGFYNIDAVRGAGIFKSTDGGATWNPLASTNPATNPDWYFVNKVTTVPLTLGLEGVLAATNGGIYRSTDAGNTWQNVYAARTVDIIVDPNNPFAVIASGGFGGIAYSKDQGLTWTPVTLGFGLVEIACATNQNGVVYASVNENGGEVWRSNDSGATWALLSTPGHLDGQGWYDNVIWVDPVNASNVVIGGIDLWRSTDGGITWAKISDWFNNMYGGMPFIPHADHHVLVADPGYNGTTNRKLYAGNDGGIFRADDISAASTTSGWATLNEGLGIVQFYSGAGHTSSGKNIIGGTQDNGSLLNSGPGLDWMMYFGGDGGNSAVDSLDDNFLYGEYVYLQLHRSTNGGSTSPTASYIFSGISDAGNGATANFIAPFVLDPNDNNRLLGGGASLWQSANVKSATPTWAPIKSPNFLAGNISAIAVAEGDSNTAWVGHQSSFRPV